VYYDRNSIIANYDYNKALIFPGYESIDFDYQVIRNVINKQMMDWKTALKNVKGVYAIFDKFTGKKYVGSAYGDSEIWSRWEQYILNGHGGNKELVKLMDDKGHNYAKQNYKFTLLEHHPMFTADDMKILRESFWKDALLSRNFGY